MLRAWDVVRRAGLLYARRGKVFLQLRRLRRDALGRLQVAYFAEVSARCIFVFCLVCWGTVGRCFVSIAAEGSTTWFGKCVVLANHELPGRCDWIAVGCLYGWPCRPLRVCCGSFVDAKYTTWYTLSV